MCLSWPSVLLLMCLGILDLNTNHSITFYPLCYKETYDLCNIHFSYHGLYSQLHHGHFSQYCFLFIKFHFTQLSKKNFLYQNKKKLLKKVKIFILLLNGIGWCHLIIYDFRSRLNQTKSGSFNCKHQSYYVEYIKYVLLQTLLKMRRIDTRIKCFIL